MSKKLEEFLGLPVGTTDADEAEATDMNEMEFLQTSVFKNASQKKMSAYKSVVNAINTIEAVENEIADARVAFVSAKVSAEKEGIRFENKLEEERAAMERAERLILQALNAIKSAKQLFN